jgi:hypothetical protein
MSASEREANLRQTTDTGLWVRTLNIKGPIL